ncbi:hypothetical protein BB934_03730 [Microvirga ossetica]|uniref:DUF6894 domain-containing protein n=1 Tax=Microvirga ossetica TaxID=1882682 RepID=A0A1B2EBV0_9HYPH|nr:hypothetical protein BB934_03730 [Microvirga ossetica]
MRDPCAPACWQRSTPCLGYFFHAFNGHAHPDTEGIELSGLEEARQEAVQTAGEIIRGNGIKSRTGSDWRMEVTDAAGQGLLRLRFSLEELSGEAPLCGD